MKLITMILLVLAFATPAFAQTTVTFEGDSITANQWYYAEGGYPEVLQGIRSDIFVVNNAQGGDTSFDIREDSYAMGQGAGIYIVLGGVNDIIQCDTDTEAIAKRMFQAARAGHRRGRTAFLQTATPAPTGPNYFSCPGWHDNYLEEKRLELNEWIRVYDDKYLGNNVAVIDTAELYSFCVWNAENGNLNPFNYDTRLALAGWISAHIEVQ